MREFTGKMLGPVDLNDALHLMGVVDGGVRTVKGALLHLDGMVTGDLLVEDGARVLLNGMVNGSVVVRGGEIEIRGHAGSVVIENDDASVWIDPDAFIGT